MNMQYLPSHKFVDTKHSDLICLIAFLRLCGGNSKYKHQGMCFFNIKLKLLAVCLSMVDVHAQKH